MKPSPSTIHCDGRNCINQKYFKSKNTETHYYDSGKIKSSKNLNTRELRKYYPNGKLKLKGQYDKYNGQIGDWIEYYENGKTKVKIPHHSDRRRVGGHWITFFHSNGNRSEERLINNGYKYILSND